MAQNKITIDDLQSEDRDNIQKIIDSTKAKETRLDNLEAQVNTLTGQVTQLRNDVNLLQASVLNLRQVLGGFPTNCVQAQCKGTVMVTEVSGSCTTQPNHLISTVLVGNQFINLTP